MKKMLLSVIAVFSLMSFAYSDKLMAQMAGPDRDPAEISDDFQGHNCPMGGGEGYQMGAGIGKKAMKQPGIGIKGMAKKPMMGENMELKIIEIIKTYDPSFASKLEQLKKDDPFKYKNVMRMAGASLASSRNIDDKDVEKNIVREISLEYEVRELSFEYNKASSNDKANIKSQIKSKLSEIFDIRTAIRELRIKELEGKVAELKSDINSRKQNKDKIIEQRLNKLTSKEAFDW